MKKNKINLIALIIILVLLVSACTRNTTPNTPNEPNTPNTPGTDNKGADNKGPDPVVTKEIPESFPEDLVPLYEVDAVEGVISVGEDYHQAYYYSNTSREDLLEMYKEYYADRDIQVFQNDFSYELSGTIDGNKIRMYIMPYNEEDTNAVTTSSQVTTQETTETEVETTEESTDDDNQRYATTVIIFIYADDTANTQD